MQLLNSFFLFKCVWCFNESLLAEEVQTKTENKINKNASFEVGEQDIHLIGSLDALLKIKIRKSL